MRPQDIPILIKILSYDKARQPWQMKDLAADLRISPSEVSESLNRSAEADLLDGEKKRVNRLALNEFLMYGIRYVFPQKPGPLARGMKTAHSAPPLNKSISSNENFVWPSADGQVLGQAIEPLYRSVVDAAKDDPFLYQCLALIDVLRMGRARERDFARKELEKSILRDGK